MSEIVGILEYRPILLSRRGEITAWALTFIIFVTLVTLMLFNVSVPLMAILLGLFFLLISCSISFGNWLDRKTVILVDTDGITFRNGLRNTRFQWSQIREVHKIPARWGTKVQVVAEETGFSFNLMGEILLNGEVKGRLGFEQGEEILGIILQRGELHPEKEENRVVYYYRQ